MNITNTFLMTTLSFWTRISSLRSYLKSIGPVTSIEDVKQLEKLSNNITKNFNLPIETSDEILDEIQSMYRDIENGVRSYEDFQLEIQAGINDINKLTIDNSEMINVVNKLFDDLLFTSTIRYSDILRSNILISLISFFELLIGDLLHLYYSSNPMALTSKEKEYSFDDIKKYNSLEDFIESIRIKKVDGFLRSSFENWEKFFLSNLKINFKTMSDDLNDMKEVILRRNIIVHNDGRISKQYLNMVDSSFLAKHNLYEGKQLLVSDQYLNKSICLYLSFGIKLIFECWGKLNKTQQKERDIVIGKITYLLIENEQWESASSILHYINTNTDEINLTNQFNYWLCEKKLNTISNKETELKQLYELDLNPIYTLCYFSLLDDKENFYRCLPKALEEGLTIDHLNQWPIFDDIRKDKYYAVELQKLI